MQVCPCMPTRHASAAARRCAREPSAKRAAQAESVMHALSAGLQSDYTADFASWQRTAEPLAYKSKHHSTSDARAASRASHKAVRTSRHLARLAMIWRASLSACPACCAFVCASATSMQASTRAGARLDYSRSRAAQQLGDGNVSEARARKLAAETLSVRSGSSPTVQRRLQP